MGTPGKNGERRTGSGKGNTKKDKGRALPSRKEGADHEGVKWLSAVSFSAQSLAVVLRETLEELELDFKRETTSRPYEQLYALIPIQRTAHVFRFRIAGECHLTMDLFDTYPSTSGSLGFMEIPELRDDNLDLAREVLRALARKLPRPPWKFTVSQRIQHSLLNPDLLRARGNWRALGIAD